MGIILGEEEMIKETESEQADAQGSSESQDNADKASGLAADTNGVKTARRSAPKIVYVLEHQLA